MPTTGSAWPRLGPRGVSTSTPQLINTGCEHCAQCPGSRGIPAGEGRRVPPQALETHGGPRRSGWQHRAGQEVTATLGRKPDAPDPRQVCARGLLRSPRGGGLRARGEAGLGAAPGGAGWRDLYRRIGLEDPPSRKLATCRPGLGGPSGRPRGWPWVTDRTRASPHPQGRNGRVHKTQTRVPC